MSRQSRALALIAAAVLAPSAARAAAITTQTTQQTVTLPLTPTNFQSGSAAVSPLTFQKFDTQNGTRQLDAVDLSFSAAIQNHFAMKFTTPATITTSVATGNPATPGPTITLYQPDGVHSLLTVTAANDPSFLTRSVTYGGSAGQTLPQSFGESFGPGSPFYLAPTNSTASNSLKLSTPADLALFTGAGNLQLPVSASAVARSTSSSGNGYGSITTQGTAAVTITYEWHDRTPAPETVPEPAAVALWGVTAAALALAHRARRR